jgi:zinc D-Ala-D-Ala dipeptidase
MKYRNSVHFLLALFIVTSNFLFVKCGAQQVPNKYGLTVIKDINILDKQAKANPQLSMTDAGTIRPAVLMDLKYASTDNFMHKKLYPTLKTTYLRQAAAEALSKAAEDFSKMNLAIKIFDAYRPYAITELMWETVKDDRYAADPAFGSGHNRGIAVDVTLVDQSTGKELPMGTGFDNFTDTAHQNFTALPENIINNRQLLKLTMEKHGFIALQTEWWHFYLPESSKYDLLDIPFNQLEAAVKNK